MDESDDSMLKEHVAMEAIKAIKTEDKEALLSALSVLISDIVEDMQSGTDQ